MTVYKLFEAQVKRSPSAMAVLFGERTLTYQELNDKSDQLAKTLVNNGAGPDIVIGLTVERSLEMLIGVLAIGKAGGAFMPVPPEYPKERKQFLIEDSKAPILLCQSRFLHNNQRIRTIALEDPDAYSGLKEPLPQINGQRDLAYVMYTSGSTGKPKGVMIEHHSLTNRLEWMQRRYPIGPGDTLVQKTPYFFDVSVWELFWGIMNGARVSLLKPGFEKFPQAIIEAAKSHSATILHFVPSMLNGFLNYIDGTKEVEKLAGIRRVFSSGETLPVPLVKKFNRILNHKNKTMLTNLYGPTEAAIDVSYYDCPVDDLPKRIPIGTPIDNTCFYIINAGKQKQLGETGELCIAGVSLARGYLNRDELTQKKFIENPFNPGSKIYKTGDIARENPKGIFEFLGRLDRQVKICGHRIELDEIESCLLENPLVKDCAVSLREISTNITRIIAFIVPEETTTHNQITEHARKWLPISMVPNLSIFLDELPLTPSGKLDRLALDSLS